MEINDSAVSKGSHKIMVYVFEGRLYDQFLHSHKEKNKQAGAQTLSEICLDIENPLGGSRLCLNLMSFNETEWIDFRHAQKLCFENTVSLGVNCLKLPGCFLICIPWKLKVYSSSHIIEPK